MILTFHGICDDRCTNVNSMSTSIFTAFLDWLAPRAANGTVVQKVGQVMGATPPPPPGPDTTPPTTSITCNSGPCSSWYNAAVTVSMSATDTGGSAVDRTVYTTNGGDPKVSGITYTGPFSVAQTSTVRFYSIDKAGNAESTRSQLIQLDTVAPTVQLTSPTTGSYRRGTLALAATASDAGSGVARVAFYDGPTLLGTDTSAPYQFTWNTRKVALGQHTLTAVATDAAGNSTTSTPPVTVTITQR